MSSKLCGWGWMVLIVVLLAGGAAAEEKESLRIDCRLESVDVNGQTITVTTGQDVDAILREKLAAEKDQAKEPVRSGRAKGGDRKVLRVGEKADITISFRTSPSVGNSLPRQLHELDKLTSYPVTLEIAPAGDKFVITKIIAWRGSPW